MAPAICFILFALFLIEAMLLGVANVVKTISHKSGESGTTVYYTRSVKAEKSGKILHYAAVFLMILTALVNTYFLITTDQGAAVTISIFIYFLLYLLGVILGGFISHFIITRLLKIYADTSLVDDMISC